MGNAGETEAEQGIETRRFPVLVRHQLGRCWHRDALNLDAQLGCEIVAYCAEYELTLSFVFTILLPSFPRHKRGAGKKQNPTPPPLPLIGHNLSRDHHTISPVISAHCMIPMCTSNWPG